MKQTSAAAFLIASFFWFCVSLSTKLSPSIIGCILSLLMEVLYFSLLMKIYKTIKNNTYLPNGSAYLDESDCTAENEPIHTFKNFRREESKASDNLKFCISILLFLSVLLILSSFLFLFMHVLHILHILHIFHIFFSSL